MNQWPWMIFLARHATRPTLVVGGVLSVLAGIVCLVVLVNQGIAFAWDFSTDIPALSGGFGRRGGWSEPHIIHHSFGAVFLVGGAIGVVAVALGVVAVVASFRLPARLPPEGRHSA